MKKITKISIIVSILFITTGFFGRSLYKKYKQSKKETKKLYKILSNNGWIKTEARITAYVPKSEKYGKYNDGKTANMDNAFKLDGVAMAEQIPFNSKVFIPGIGTKEVDDRGSAMNNSFKNGIIHIDLRVKNLKIAKEWGVKKKTVFIKIQHQK